MNSSRQNMLPMAIVSNGAVSSKLIQKRRVMSRSSGLSSSTVTMRGSRAMPQIGQLPCSARTTSGCMGQVNSVLLAASGGDSGSNAMPHFGHGPGPSCRTSGHIGQTWARESFPDSPGSGAFAGATGLLPVGITIFGPPAEVPRDTSPDVIVTGLVIGLGGADRIFSGLAWNFARQPAQQKKYSWPACSVLWRAVAGFTSIPQTGSLALVLAVFGRSTGSRWSIV